MKNSIAFILFSIIFMFPLKSVSQLPNSSITFTYLTSWGERGENEVQFKEPNGISVSPEGNIYIADTGNQRIQKISRYGEFIKTVGGFGWGIEEFDKPVSLCAVNGLDVFVADYNNHRIERYDKDLNYLATFTTDNVSEELQMGYPLDVDISTQGELFCIDGDNGRILKLNLEGKPQLSFGDYDAGRGRLFRPVKMCILENSSIYISDPDKQVIVVFDIYGNYIFQFGSDILHAPHGVAFIDSEYLLVTDLKQETVYLFDTKGRMITEINRKKSTGSSFQTPVDVCSYDDKIYILDRTACRIDIFQININKGQSE